MSKHMFAKLIGGALKKFGQENFEPPRELMDRPNGVVYPVLERMDLPGPDFSQMAGMQHSPLGAAGMAMGEEAEGMMGGPEAMAGMMGGDPGMDPGMAEQMPMEEAAPPNLFDPPPNDRELS